MKKALSILLSILLVFSTTAFALTAAAEAPTIVDRGYCGGEGDGTNLTWVLTNDGTLTISGEGAMKNFSSSSSMPWRNYRWSADPVISTLIIDDGVTTIGNYAFSSCTSLSSASLPTSLTSIGYFGFNACYALTEVTLPEGLQRIGERAFESTAIRSIVVPSSVRHVADGGLNIGNLETAVILSKTISFELTQLNPFSSRTTVYGYTDMNWSYMDVLGHQSKFIPLCPTDYTHTLTAVYEENQTCSSYWYDLLFYHEQYYQPYTSWYCETCGKYVMRENVCVNDELAEVNVCDLDDGLHVYESVVTPATCTEDGFTTYTCTRCGKTYVGDTTPAGHAPGETVIENDVPATCTEAGGYDEVVYCTQCPAEISRNHIDVPAPGHSWGEWEVIKQATVDETGLMRRTCQNDSNHVEEQVIPKLQPQTSVFQQFIERVEEFFRNITNWFSRLFRW